MLYYSLKKRVLDKMEIGYLNLKIQIFNNASPQVSVDFFLYIHDIIYFLKVRFCHIAILTPHSPIFI